MQRLQPGPDFTSRAIGLLQILDDGKARIVPIAIFDDGKWYDAQVYRANPIPMAVDRDTVYEATQLGESQGLFTITAPRSVLGHWVGKGKWEPATTDAPAKKLASLPLTKIADPDDRPILRKPSSKPGSKPDDLAPAPDAIKPTATPETKATPKPD